MNKSEEENIREVHEALAMMNEYHATVGRFVLQWAETEAVLYRVLLHYSHVDDKVGRAILSGTKATQLMTYTQSIAENIGLDSRIVNDLDSLFLQIGVIKTLRDRLVHYGRVGFRVNTGIAADTEGMINRRQEVSNKERVARLKSGQILLVETSTLQPAFDDLLVIEQCLSTHLKSHFSTAERDPWLYKSLQPVAEKDKSQKVDRERSAPPQSSRKSPRSQSRNDSHPSPPPQIRACGATAHGSCLGS